MFARVTAPLVEQVLSTGCFHRQSLYIAARYLKSQAGETQGMVRRDRGYGMDYTVSSTYMVICMGQFLSHCWLFHHKGVHFLECDNISMYNGLPFHSHTNFTRTTGLERVIVNSWSMPLILRMSCLEANRYLTTKPSTHAWCGIFSLIKLIS